LFLTETTQFWVHVALQREAKPIPNMLEYFDLLNQ